MNLLGIDIKPLLNELVKFRQDQAKVITLLEQNNHFQKLILNKLGGKVEK